MDRNKPCSLVEFSHHLLQSRPVCKFFQSGQNLHISYIWPPFWMHFSPSNLCIFEPLVFLLLCQAMVETLWIQVSQQPLCPIWKRFNSVRIGCLEPSYWVTIITKSSIFTPLLDWIHAKACLQGFPITCHSLQEHLRYAPRTSLCFTPCSKFCLVSNQISKFKACLHSEMPNCLPKCNNIGPPPSLHNFWSFLDHV